MAFVDEFMDNMAQDSDLEEPIFNRHHENYGVLQIDSEYEYSTEEDDFQVADRHVNSITVDDDTRVVPSSSVSRSGGFMFSDSLSDAEILRRWEVTPHIAGPSSASVAPARRDAENESVEVFEVSDDESQRSDVNGEGAGGMGGGEQESARSSGRRRSDSVIVIENASANENGQGPNVDHNRYEHFYRVDQGRALPDNDNESQSGDETGEENDDGPARKMARIEPSTQADDDEGFICQICYEPFTNSGGHRVCCLKCGHVYGMDCITKWIQSSKRCPSCNCKALKKDIRIIYVKNLKAADTAEVERLKEDLRKAMIEKNKTELTYQTLKQKEVLHTKEIQRLEMEIKELKTKQYRGDDQLPGPSSRQNSQHESTTSISTSTALKFPKLSLVKHFDIKEGQSRVGTYNEWMNMFVVSHAIKSPLFPGGSYGIKKINSLEWKVFQSSPIHQKPLRDMEFNSAQSELLLTVGLDKKAILFNTNSNVTVQTFNTEYPLWSCCWNTVDQQIFYVGASNGQVTAYDIRSPQEPLGNLVLPTTDRSSVARLKFVPPAYQNQSFNMSGLMIQKLNSVWFGEMTGGNLADIRYHQLPVEGPFSNIDFEPSTRQVLISCRPKQIPGERRRQGSSHLLCDLKKNFSEEENRFLFSCDITQSITSGLQEYTTLCRSALFASPEKTVYLAANAECGKAVRVWDVSNSEQKSLVRIKDDLAMDFVHGQVNGKNFLGIVADKSTDIYEIK